MSGFINKFHWITSLICDCLPLFNRKCDHEYNEDAQSSECVESSPCTEEASSPLQTPVFGGKRDNVKFLPPIPVSKDGLLTKKLLNLLKHTDEGILDLNIAAVTLEVEWRQIYDITNFLEGIGLIERKINNQICLKAHCVSQAGDNVYDFYVLQAEIENLSFEEHTLDDKIRDMEGRLTDFSENEDRQRWLYISEEDITGRPCLQKERLIATKAPHIMTLEISDPNEVPQIRYRMELRSTTDPTDVYLVSHFEENFEEMARVEVPTDAPSVPNFGYIEDDGSVISPENSNNGGLAADCQRISADCNSCQDLVSGMMNVIPSNADIQADYWLLSDDDVSLTDMWKTEPDVQWDDADSLDADYVNVSISELQHSSDVKQIPTSNSKTGG